MKHVLVLLIFISVSSVSRALADSELPKGFFETKDRFEQLQFIERLTIRNLSDENDDGSSDELIAETSTAQNLAATVD